MNKFVAAALISSAFAATSAVAATATNPLDASYYQGRPTTVVTQPAGSETANVERSNPLAASYYTGKPTSAYVGTAANVPPKGYIGTINPLDATYYWSSAK